MAAFLPLAPLLLLGTVSGQAWAETDDCIWLWNTTEGNFSVEVAPETYQANTSYVVTIKDDRNHTNSLGQYLLQALIPQNASVGEWKEVPTAKCGSIETALLESSENTTLWISPDSNLSSVQVRVYFTLPNTTAELKTFTLNGEVETPTITPNSVCRAQSSSFFLAALQLPLLLLTGSLLS